MAGRTCSYDGDVSGWHEGYDPYEGYPLSDCWVVKLNSRGEIEWQRCLGGSYEDWAYSIQQTSDGGFIVAGETCSNDGDVSGNHGEYDFWVVKLNSSGEIEWQRCLGGSDYDYASSIQQTLDGGFIVAGYTKSNDGDVSGWHEGYDPYGGDPLPDCWVVKLNSSGEIEWQRCLGGSEIDGAKSIQQTTEGGFIVAGYSESNDGDVSGNHGEGDAWVVKLSPPEGITETAAKPDAPTIKVSPNPFNSVCEISVPVGAEVLIYDIEGNLVHRTAARGGKVIWVPGKTVASGVYTVRVHLAGGKTANRKVVYLK